MSTSPIERKWRLASERLRTSILSALSHDVRTPLTSIVGLADSLTLQRTAAAGRRPRNAGAIRDQAGAPEWLPTFSTWRESRRAGVKPRKEWQLLEEVAGAQCSFSAARSRTPRRRSTAEDHAADRVRRGADRARVLQPHRERREVFAARDADLHPRTAGRGDSSRSASRRGRGLSQGPAG
jgi:signal transduction histidine kinase